MKYNIKEFDRTNTDLIIDLINYFIDIDSSIRIKVWDEMTGFDSFVSLDELKKELFKQYCKFDEIYLVKADKDLLEIIMHEDLCILDINEEQKKHIGSKFGQILIQFKEN